MAVTDRAEAVVTSLQRALASEHVAVYGYGVLGPRLAAPLQPAAQQQDDAHRQLRDRLRDQIRARGATPVASASAYQLPVEVTDPASALRLAVTLEADCAARYAALVGAAGSAGLRRLAVGWLAEVAVAADRWRRAETPPAPGVPLPGLSGAPG